MTTENSRADALTDAVWRLKRDLERGDMGAGTCLVYMADLLTILAASPSSQPAAAPIANAELASMTRMFQAACHDLGLINEALGLDPEDGGAAPILDAIAELKRERDQWVDANYAAPSPADERAAFDYDDVVSICDAHGICLPVDCVEMVVEIVKRSGLLAARAASANETGAEGSAIHQVRTKGSLKWQDIEPISLSMFADEERYVQRVVYAAPQPAQADARDEDAYVAKRLSEVLASVYTTLIGDDEADADEILNAIERVERAAQVLRLEVELYRGQADARVGMTATVIQKCIDSCAAEYLEDVTGHPEDAAYCQGITDCIDALNRLKTADWSALLAAHPGQPVADDAAVRGDEPKAYLIEGLNGYSEETSSVWIKRANAEAAAAMLFRASITPLVAARATAAQAGALTDERIDRYWQRYKYGRRPKDVTHKDVFASILREVAQSEPRAEVALFEDSDERDEFVRACQDFDDDGETSIDYGLLMKWASDGLLDCDHFTITKKGRSAIDAAREGGAS